MVVQLNTWAEKLVGYTREELLNISVAALMPISASNHFYLRKKHFENPTPRILGKWVSNLAILYKEGHNIPMDASLFTIPSDISRLVVNSICDISTLKAEEEALVKKALYD